VRIKAHFHEGAGTEYDAAFDWYLARSPDAARRFDAEVTRAVEQIVQAPTRWATGAHSNTPIPSTPLPLRPDLSDPSPRRGSDHRGFPHEQKTGILESPTLNLYRPMLA